MPSEGKNRETTINVILDEPLTSDSCVKLIMELVKYILYQKQQIPFSCDSLIQLQTKVKPTDRNFSCIKAVLNSLKNTSDQLASQLVQQGSTVKEIVIIVGATIVSPKFHVKLELPSQILDSQKHFEYKHSSRKPLINLMRSMLQCPELQEELTLPLNPTNTFVLLQKTDYNSVSEFFLPKPQYMSSSQTSSCFRIKLHHNSQVALQCNCVEIVQVYDEISDTDVGEKKKVRSMDSATSDQSSYIWYQSKEVIKGFKYAR